MTPESEDKPLLKYLSGLVKGLHEDLPNAQGGDVDAIHDVRVATRRLKAALELFEPHLSKDKNKRFGKALRKVRRTFGELRDLDVMTEHLATLRGHEPARKYLIENLKNRRAVTLARLNPTDLTEVLGKLSVWWELNNEIASQPAAALLRASLKAQLDGFRQKATALASGDPAQSVHPHELRIAGKALRYTLEMAKEDGIKTPGNLARSFKKMQDLLGTWHDFVVLTNTVLSTAVDETLGYIDPKLLANCLKLAQFTSKRADTFLNQFNRLWLKSGVTLEQQLQAAIEPPQAEAHAVEIVSPLPPAPSLAPTLESPDAPSENLAPNSMAESVQPI